MTELTGAAGHGVRPAAAEDLAAVAELLLADQRDRGEPITLDAGFLRDMWSRPGFTLATDAWVATRDGVIAGYGQAWQEEPEVVGSWGVVHPGHRGQGIGSALLDRITARVGELLAPIPDGRFRHSINASDHAAAALLRGRGMRVVRHFWHMERELAADVEAGAAPAGVTIRPITGPDELVAVHAVLDEAFTDDWGYHPGPFGAWAAEHTGNPAYDPELWLLALDGDSPAGAVTGSVYDDDGWIDLLGVTAAARGRGVGAALLRHAFARLAERGATRVIVNVDAGNPTGATALYERAGMRVAKQWDLWER